VDSGYRNQVGYLAPYKGQTTRYHVAEFRGAAAPQGIAETFNYAHSSLRNVVERSIGVLKQKWKMLKEIPSYSPMKQRQIVQAACALHNFVRESGLQDKHFTRCDRDESYVPRQAYDDQPDPDEIDDEPNDMNMFRDMLAFNYFYRQS
jgi:thiamine kinase-like enzyme